MVFLRKQSDMKIFNALLIFTFHLLLPFILGDIQRTILDDFGAPIWKMFKIIALQEKRAVSQDKRYRKQLENINKAFQRIKPSTPFPCHLSGKFRSDTVPTSVHQIRPGDIDVVGNLGDSLSAGTGTSDITVLQLIVSEDRGRSFSGGGEETWRTFLTLPNILKEFNPNLFGFALRTAQSTEYASQFNVAENGAISSSTTFMVKELVKRIKNDHRVDLKNHWKMITLMIGDNDFCSEVCYLPNYYDALERHRQDLLFVLRYLRDNLPRTIVNVIPAPRLDIFFEMKNLPLGCYVVQNVACPCVRGLAFENKRKILSDVMIKWQEIDINVSNLAEFDLDDFTVIPHCFTKNYFFPRTLDNRIDFGFLAPDCFHFSEKAHARFANDLWNSLMEPFGNKSTDGSDVFSRFLCPTKQHPYIFTRRNSR